jgi:hypothetical protein
MLRITRDATKYLVRLREEYGLSEEVGLRLIRNASGFGLTFASEPDPRDRVVANDVPLYVAEDLASRLEGSIIDLRVDAGGQSRLALRPHVVAR